MYICNVCGGEFQYLIFEYNSIVCEKCSISKNISNCHELDITPIEIEEAREKAENAYVEVEERDAEQLFDLIEQIQNPRIREDFLDLAEQYLQGS